MLELVDVPDPAPADDEVLIRIHAAGVAPGDGKVRAGTLQHMFPVTLPKIPGRDGAGVVVAKGRRATYLEIGDPVCFTTPHVGQGSAAELIARGKGDVARKPKSLSFVEAAALVHSGMCAWIGLVETADIKSGMKVLIHGGAGAIGSMAVQIARHRGAEVAATCRSTDAPRVAALGAQQVIAFDREDFAASLAGFDVVFDLVGGEVHDKSYSVLKRGGMLVWLYARPIEDRAPPGIVSRRAAIHDRIETLEAVLALAAERRLRAQPGRVFPLAQCAEAHRLVAAGGHGGGRVVLKIV